MIKLLAMSVQDGWAVARMAQGLRLIRPPYADESRCRWIDDVDMNRLLSDGDFSLCEPAQPFQDYSSVIDYLRRAIAQAAGPTLQEDARRSALQLLCNASTDTIGHFLQRIQEKHFPDEQYCHAQTILAALLRSPTMQSDPDSYQKTLEVLDKSIQGLKEQQDRQNMVSGLKELIEIEYTGPKLSRDETDKVLKHGLVQICGG